MTNKLWVLGPALALSISAAAAESLVRFEGGIGSTPFSRGAGGVAAPNVVLGVTSGGQPWVIARLRADVKTDGRIRVDGEGLLLGGGNSIGTNANQSVRARLFCGGVEHNSGLVPLEANGDFRIDDVLDPVPPDPCTSPVLLIVNAGGSWFAAGIPRREGDRR